MQTDLSMDELCHLSDEIKHLQSKLNDTYSLLKEALEKLLLKRMNTYGFLQGYHHWQWSLVFLIFLLQNFLRWIIGQVKQGIKLSKNLALHGRSVYFRNLSLPLFVYFWVSLSLLLLIRLKYLKLDYYRFL